MEHKPLDLLPCDHPIVPTLYLRYTVESPALRGGVGHRGPSVHRRGPRLRATDRGGGHPAHSQRGKEPNAIYDTVNAAKNIANCMLTEITDFGQVFFRNLQAYCIKVIGVLFVWIPGISTIETTGGQSPGIGRCAGHDERP